MPKSLRVVKINSDSGDYYENDGEHNIVRTSDPAHDDRNDDDDGSISNSRLHAIVEFHSLHALICSFSLADCLW